MDETPNLKLPYIMAAQAQKHVTHNEAIRALDALVQASVLDRHLASPPPAPSDGARYIVAAGATGAWTGKTGQIAAFQDGAWMFYPPHEGWLTWVADEDQLVAYDGAAWVAAGGGGGGSVNPTPLVGVNATADTTNRLSVSSPASLFNHEGSDHRLKVNKAAAANTASVLFQTGFSGRAEFGTTGDDDWRVKVSPNGTTWFDAIIANRNTGAVSFPNTPLAGRVVLTANRTYYVRTDGNDANTGLTDTSGGAFRTIQNAINVVSSIDLASFSVTIQVRNGTFTENLTLKSYVGAGPVTILGDATTPANVVLAGGASPAVMATAVSGNYTFQGLKITGSSFSFLIQGGSVIAYRDIDFGGTNVHIGSYGGSVVTKSGNVTISAGAVFHWLAKNNGVLSVSNNTITLTGTPAFSGSFALAQNGGIIECDSITFSGSATGKRYDVIGNAVINTNGAGASYLPGNSAGTTGTGGQYV
jgi:hypothetical protein